MRSSRKLCADGYFFLNGLVQYLAVRQRGESTQELILSSGSSSPVVGSAVRCRELESWYAREFEKIKGFCDTAKQESQWSTTGSRLTKR